MTQSSVPQRRTRAAEPGTQLALWHVVGLTAWAIAQPLLSVLRHYPEWLIAHRLDVTSMLALLAVMMALVPILVAALTTVVARLANPRAARWCAQSAVGMLAGLATWTVARQGLGSSSPTAAFVPFLVVSVAAGVWIATRWHRRPWLRTFLTALLPGVVLFPLAFVVREPVRTLLWPRPATVTGEIPVAGRATLATTEQAIDSPALVVFVLLDELPLLSLLDPNLHIDAPRFPGFARWATLGTWYRNATTVADATAQAVPALLTGRLPNGRATPTLADHPNNLFTRLGAADLPLHVLETQTALAPPRSPTDGRTTEDAATTTRTASTSAVITLLADAAAVSLVIALPPALHTRMGLPPVDRGWRDTWRRADSVMPITAGGIPVPPTVQRLFAGLEARPEGLHFAHVLLPHVPWERLPSGAQYDGSEIPGLLNHLWTGDPWLIIQAYQRHLLQVGYVDALLNELAERLDAMGRLDDALVVIAADHGVAFTAHQPWRRVNRHNAVEIANIPLLIKRPGQRVGEVDDRPVETIDVLPTVLARLGISVGSVDGHDLDDPAWSDRRADTPRRCFVARLRVPATQVTLPADWQARRDERLAWKQANLGTGNLFAIGPHATLIGQPVTALATTASGTRGWAQLEDWDADAGALLIRLEGTLEGLEHTGTMRENEPPDDGIGGVPIVVAIDGVIRASTRTHSARGAVRFSVMLDPNVMPRDPRSAITLHRVVETANGPRLIPLAISAREHRPTDQP